MKKNKKLNIRGTLLDRNQFSKHIEKSASEHIIKNNSSKKTYPIYNLIDDYKFILETYNLLSKHLKLGIKIHSAGEWILDNFYIIEENVKMIQKDLSAKKYKNMVGLSNDNYYGYARCAVLAEEIVAFSDCKIDEDLINLAINSYQKKRLLGLEEFCNLGIFLKISIISRIRELCEKIYSSQVQKYKAESIIERLIEGKNNLKYSNNNFLKINEESIRYPFIEYMSYKLKKYGKKAIIYQDILEKEVQKTGLSVSEVIQKEHFNIANIKVTMGNCITSIKEINRIDFSEMFSYMNVSEDLLKKDPAKIYSKMDEESKNYYRGIIEKKSKKSKLSEIYISEKIIDLCKRYENAKNLEEQKKSHVGYYLLTKEGIEELNDRLEIKNRKSLNIYERSRIYTFLNIFVPIFLSFAIFYKYQFQNPILSLIVGIISYIPISEIFLKIENYIMGKLKSPTFIPKMDFQNCVPEEDSTFVVIPTILKSKEKVQEMFDKLEVYYLANKLDNIYFALLGDCSEENKETKEFDEDVIYKGKEICEELNKKYYKDGFSRFHFLYRKRQWNSSERSYIGWERKRGLLSTFNKYIKNIIDNNFLINTIENQKDLIPNIKYIITLDSDTNLNLNSASKLIGAMSHILNLPIIKDFKVVDGYGIMQPRIGMDLSLAQKTLFIELFSMKGGIDCYTNAISDIYQDYFGEGIFTGKGIYNVDVYNLIMDGEIPENTVLSHDLLEGNFLRCGLLTDIMLLDGYPTKYIPYILRNHRWTRGDWQIIRWLKSSRLNLISKYKIYDNLRRSLLQFFALILLCFGLVFKNKLLTLIPLISITIPFFIDIINYVLFKESNISGASYAYKKFSGELSSIKISFIRIVLQIAFLPYEAIKNLDSIIRSIYRMKKKTKLLEWVTAEDGEKNSKNDLKSYYSEMIANFMLGFFIIVFNPLISLLWILGPIIAWYISLEKGTKRVNIERQRRYLIDIGKRTWSFFENYINEENNYLIPDNYQEDRKNKIVNRTSSTNIGLELIVVISAYDLGFISFKKCIDYLNKIITTVCGLSKWNGHLYNWYNTKTLIPLIPRYVSTVDSGNFVGYLFIVKDFLVSNKNKGEVEKNLIYLIEELIKNTDFSKLYSEKTKLLSVGFNLEENKLTDSYYDFLASEARQASLIAIAKGDIPSKHWNNLSRTLTSLNGYKGLISWTGTAFEYLMPNINLKRYKGSILDEASKFAIMSQIEYCKKLKIPWGISEAAFDLRDLNNNYQYKAFGIPWLGLRRGLEEEIVVSPYSTFLSLEDEFDLGIENLKKIENDGGLNKYGFYESIDYTPNRNKDKKFAVVKTYMAHHQALIFLSINNVLNNNILRKRFNNNKEIEACNILLQERMPVQLIITKEKKEKILKNKNIVSNSYKERLINSHSKKNREINVISNENYKIIIDDYGNSSSEYKNLMVNRYKETLDINQGINSYIKNIRTKKIIKTEDNSQIIFSPDKIQFNKIENNLKISETVFLDPNRPIEIRRIEINNLGSQEEVLEVVYDFEPSMSKKMQDYSHPAFNKLFMRISNENDNVIFVKKDRNLIQDYYLATSLYTENEQIVDFEFETNREKYLGRENFSIPIMIKEQKKFSNSTAQVTDPIIAMKRTIKIKGKETAFVNLIISVSENKNDAIDGLETLKSEEEIIRTLKLAKVRIEEESKYLQIDGDKQETFAKLLKYILLLNNKKDCFLNNAEKNSLWKFGISGNLPIIMVEIKNIEDMYVVEEIINAYEYYRAKNIFIDLIILNKEINVYEKFVRECVEEVISNKQISYLKNISGGIFIINNDEIPKEDLEVLRFKSRIIIDAKKGGIESYLKDFEEIQKPKNEFKRERNKIELEQYPLKKNNLIFDNTFGGFEEGGKEYFIYKNKENILPTVWSNILANKRFGSVVTDNLGGYTWSKNCRLNRLTSWSNDSIRDIPSEIFYIKDEDNKEFWTLNSNIIPNANYYYITHGFGFTKLKNTNDNLNQELEIVVPNEDELKIFEFRIKNLINEERNIKLFFYIKPVLGEDEYLNLGNLFVEKENNIIKIRNTFPEENFKNRITYITSNLSINSFTGDKNSFFGEGDLLNPECLYNGLDNSSGYGKECSVGIEFDLKLDKFEDKKFNIILGEASNNEEIENMYEKYNLQTNAESEIVKTKTRWNDLILNTIKVKTPSESINILMNGWLIYQTVSSRLYGKTGYYQSGGAVGFRDQLQDCLSLKYVDSKILKDQILLCARHQFLEGDVLHWWHNETKRGVRTKFTDDLLWLVYSVLEYINFENDKTILDEEVEYLNGKKLNNNENESYDLFYESKIKEPLFEHCVRAIECVLSRGIDKYPKIGSGDWNDGFSNIGVKGIGESVWLGMFLYDILNRFIPICNERNRKDLEEYYKGYKEKLKRNINLYGWDGRWYKRAINDDNIEIGSISSDECRIDSISQSWSVISDIGDNDKKFIAINEAENYLVDRENKIIKLFDPPFDKTDFNPGYIKSYPPGIRENGGQYTHGSCWLIIAEAILGFGDKAVEFAELINPIEHSKSREEAKRYKLEPYVIEADLYSNKDLLGQGGWNWYTGSSSWYYKAVLEYILGLKIENGYLRIDPCISKNWKEFEIIFKYKTSSYVIKVKNLNGKNTGISSFILNGQEIKEKKILLQDNCKINNIEISM